MPNRRDFLKSIAGASAGMIFVGCSVCDARAARIPTLAQANDVAKRREVMVGKRRVKTVDVHCHVSVPGVLDVIKGTNVTRRPSPYNSDDLTEGRIQSMDKMGIDVQAVSINPFWYNADKDLAIRVIDFQNERMSAICAKHPDRFVAFAAVALQFPELAAQQLEEGMKKWGFRGAAIGCSVEGEDLSAPRYEPFWAKAEELQALIFVHPQNPAINKDIEKRLEGSGALVNSVSYPLETSIFLSHMIFEGVFDKFPNLRICAAHGGGYLPSYPSRMDHGCDVFPEQCPKAIKKHPSEYLKQIYVDAMVFTAEGLRHLIAVVGPSNIGLGTDYPFPWELNPVDHVLNQPSLSDADKIAILGGNMCKLLKIPV
ncbi:MAG: amidohydrolase family protein [Candidatus Acidiferrales bacterium]|jgi:aminocarboxymuconate-semialdehyde decarboxylase